MTTFKNNAIRTKGVIVQKIKRAGKRVVEKLKKKTPEQIKKKETMKKEFKEFTTIINKRLKNTKLELEIKESIKRNYAQLLKEHPKTAVGNSDYIAGYKKYLFLESQNYRQWKTIGKITEEEFGTFCRFQLFLYHQKVSHMGSNAHTYINKLISAI